MKKMRSFYVVHRGLYLLVLIDINHYIISQIDKYIDPIDADMLRCVLKNTAPKTAPIQIISYL